MSLFEWDATKGSEVVNRRFWVYWAITIPLTIVTFMAWMLWLRYQREDAARKRIDATTTTTTNGGNLDLKIS